MIFVTARISAVDMTAIRQGWMVDNTSRLIGESGEVYPVYGSVTVVTNPPDQPSAEALESMKALKGPST